MVSGEVALDRREVVGVLIGACRDALVVSGLGSPSYDVHAQGDRDGTFYLWGAMGSAALVGLGLAQAQPNRQVLVITGDGEQLMGLGGLATIAVAGPSNLTVAVIDNGHFGETGMQPSHTSHGVDLSAIASACGFPTARTVRDAVELEWLAVELGEASPGPRLLVIKVRADSQPRSLPPRDAVWGKNRVRQHLGLQVK